MADDVTDFDITDAMISFGGGFAAALAGAFRRADEINQARIKMAFPELWEQYAETVRLHRQRQGQA